MINSGCVYVDPREPAAVEGKENWIWMRDTDATGWGKRRGWDAVRTGEVFRMERTEVTGPMEEEEG